MEGDFGVAVGGETESAIGWLISQLASQKPDFAVAVNGLNL